ncbi:MAG: 16S rRNA (adenine(1518)-N(6)/adenine(1519)-N(6))-dimethyltransferase RsmA [Patescibacteria group bacterium]|jgi:16S rRNA (adenine1518-N6/adenine1519-N6)-dimethyltransferase
MSLTDIHDLQKLLESERLTPNHRLGQNFLVDQAALEAIVAAADLGPGDAVLEIGPGLGTLTTELVQKAGKVLAVELDQKLIKLLRQRFKDQTNLEILEGDILKFKNQELSDRLGGEYKLVANLPYNLTGQILRKFLSYPPRPKTIVLLLQKEVAERITAGPGKMSVLAVAVQLYGEAKIAVEVGRQSFHPAPEVDSAAVVIRPWPEAPDGLDEKKFWQIVKAGFAARRKQLQNNLANLGQGDKNAVKNILIKAKLSPLARAQDLSVADWLRLAKMF